LQEISDYDCSARAAQAQNSGFHLPNAVVSGNPQQSARQSSDRVSKLSWQLIPTLLIAARSLLRGVHGITSHLQHCT
jgi:uncharacterized membrane-anchored protein